jgi:hypothetical protein
MARHPSLDARRLAEQYASVSGPTRFARAKLHGRYLAAAQRVIDAVYLGGFSDEGALALALPMLPDTATDGELESWGDFCLWALNRIAKDD